MFVLEGTAMAGTLWKDWPKDQQEVGQFLLDKRIMVGYSDGTFKPWEPVSEIQVVRVMNRAGIRSLPEGDFNYVPATMEWVENNFMPGTVFSAGPKEQCTRFRLAVMLSRYVNEDGSFKEGPTTPVVPTPEPVDERVALLNQLFKEHPYNGKLTPFIGHEKLFLELSDTTGVPLWLALAQGWKESCWGTAGSSIWGLKSNSGFISYSSVEDAMRAYYKLIRYGPSGSGRYWNYLQARNIDALVELYAPSYENNHSSYMATLWIVKSWVNKKGL